MIAVVQPQVLPSACSPNDNRESKEATPEKKDGRKENRWGGPDCMIFILEVVICNN
jgi:hypothetical protein